MGASPLSRVEGWAMGEGDRGGEVGRGEAPATTTLTESSGASQLPFRTLRLCGTRGVLYLRKDCQTSRTLAAVRFRAVDFSLRRSHEEQRFERSPARPEGCRHPRPRLSVLVLALRPARPRPRSRPRPPIRLIRIRRPERDPAHGREGDRGDHRHGDVAGGEGPGRALLRGGAHRRGAARAGRRVHRGDRADHPGLHRPEPRPRPEPGRHARRLVRADRPRPAGRQGAGRRLSRRLRHLALALHAGHRSLRHVARRGAARTAGHPVRRRLGVRHDALHHQPAAGSASARPWPS